MTDIEQMLNSLTESYALFERIDLSADEAGFIRNMRALVEMRGPEELYETEQRRIRELYREKIGGRP